MRTMSDTNDAYKPGSGHFGAHLGPVAEVVLSYHPLSKTWVYRRPRPHGLVITCCDKSVMTELMDYYENMRAIEDATE
jgi:hypothetical protein